jgi:hypothetical protein
MHVVIHHKSIKAWWPRLENHISSKVRGEGDG